jgi:hypothetical protein
MDLENQKQTDPWDWPEDAGEALLAILKDDRASVEELCEAALEAMSLAQGASGYWEEEEEEPE